MESSRTRIFSICIIQDCLYGPDDGSEIRASVDAIADLSILRNWTSAQWSDLLQKYHILCAFAFAPPSLVLLQILYRPCVSRHPWKTFGDHGRKARKGREGSYRSSSGATWARWPKSSCANSY